MCFSLQYMTLEISLMRMKMRQNTEKIIFLFHHYVIQWSLMEIFTTKSLFVLHSFRPRKNERKEKNGKWEINQIFKLVNQKEMKGNDQMFFKCLPNEIIFMWWMRNQKIERKKRNSHEMKEQSEKWKESNKSEIETEWNFQTVEHINLFTSNCWSTMRTVPFKTNDEVRNNERMMMRSNGKEIDSYLETKTTREIDLSPTSTKRGEYANTNNSNMEWK